MRIMSHQSIVSIKTGKKNFKNQIKILQLKNTVLKLKIYWKGSTPELGRQKKELVTLKTG